MIRWPRSFRKLPVLSRDEVEARAGQLPAATIPRVIHQIWLGTKRPPLRTMESCRRLNPGWLHVLWTEENLPPLRNQAAFDAQGTSYHAKADVLRYELLHRYGGVYVDADQLCLRPLDDLLDPGDAFFAGYQNLHNPDLDDERRAATLVANAVVGAAAGHPILERVIRDIGGGSTADGREPWVSVGPGALTRAIEETPSRAVVHPFHEFYPYHFTEPIPADPRDMVKAIHYLSHSVSLWGTTRRRYGWLRPLPGLGPSAPPEARPVPAEFAARHPRLPPTVLNGEGPDEPPSPSSAATRRLPDGGPARSARS